MAEARCPASIRSQAAASAPNRPPTSTPTTTADSAHELGGSGGVCVGRRHRQLDRWGCTSAPGWAVTGLMMVASTACCAPCHKARSRQFRCGGHRRPEHRCSCLPGEHCGRLVPQLPGTPSPPPEKGSGCEHTGSRTCCPVVAEWVKATPAGARALCDWQQQTEPS